MCKADAEAAMRHNFGESRGWYVAALNIVPSRCTALSAERNVEFALYELKVGCDLTEEVVGGG